MTRVVLSRLSGNYYMATCPRCHGALTDTHQCPRRKGRTAVRITIAAVAGGLMGLVVAALLDPNGDRVELDVLALGVGILAGIALDRGWRSWRSAP
jgi:hypothetical protein